MNRELIQLRKDFFVFLSETDKYFAVMADLIYVNYFKWKYILGLFD